MTEEQPIRVLIADDFDVMRDVMHVLREDAEDIEVVGEAPDLDDALEKAVALQPDVIILRSKDYLASNQIAPNACAPGAIGFQIIVTSQHSELPAAYCPLPTAHCLLLTAYFPSMVRHHA